MWLLKYDRFVQRQENIVVSAQASNSIVSLDKEPSSLKNATKIKKKSPPFRRSLRLNRLSRRISCLYHRLLPNKDAPRLLQEYFLLSVLSLLPEESLLLEYSLLLRYSLPPNHTFLVGLIQGRRYEAAKQLYGGTACFPVVRRDVPRISNPVSSDPIPGGYVERVIPNSILSRDYIIVLPLPFKATSIKQSYVDTIDLTDFLLDLPPFAAPVIEQANPAALVNRMLPLSAISPGARYVATCFWAWLCVLDGRPPSRDSTPFYFINKISSRRLPSFTYFTPDLTEDGDTSNTLEHCISILSRSPYTPCSENPPASSSMAALQNVVQTACLSTLPSKSTRVVHEPWKQIFWSEVAVVARALVAETGLRGRAFSLSEWMDLRILTIAGMSYPPTHSSEKDSSRRFFKTRVDVVSSFAARPFMVLARASLFLSPSVPHTALHSTIPLILGLQNDILGWQKDHLASNPLNAVEVLIRDGWEEDSAFACVLEGHNALVRGLSEDEKDKIGGVHGDYEVLVKGMANAMGEWMLGCERYRVC
ncbi:hypothetical protein MMC12_005297 [Toensbergia leucococca]|nr:hypothetical protein [Toensbergia leucococca]